MLEFLARGVAPKLQFGVLREVWLVDALLSPIGLLAAFASTREHFAYLLVMPLGALLAVSRASAASGSGRRSS